MTTEKIRIFGKRKKTKRKKQRKNKEKMFLKEKENQ